MDCLALFTYFNLYVPSFHTHSSKTSQINLLGLSQSLTMSATYLAAWVGIEVFVEILTNIETNVSIDISVIYGDFTNSLHQFFLK